MAEGADSGSHMPERVYTKGDEVRLNIEIVTDTNPTYVTALFHAEHDERLTFTMHDNLILEDPPEREPQSIPVKTYKATLVSLVEPDHVPGVYRLEYLVLNNPLTTEVSMFNPQSRGDFEGGPVRFCITEKTDVRTYPRVTAQLVDPPADN